MADYKKFTMTFYEFWYFKVMEAVHFIVTDSINTAIIKISCQLALS